MWSKVILFCALLFGFKFVEPNPFDEELGQQRAYQPNSWQGNVNTGGQYHGSDFTRVHSTNVMTSSAHQFPPGKEFEPNRGRQLHENYENNFLHSLQSLPAVSNPINVAREATNDHRKGGFVSRVDNFPIRKQHHRPIRGDDDFKRQNWQSHSRYENPPTSAIGNIATAQESPLTVPKPYRNIGQAIPAAPVNRQHYQAQNLYPKELHYRPVPQKSGSGRYIAENRPNSEIFPVPIRYESYHEAREHNTNIAHSGHDAYVGKVPILPEHHNSYGFKNYNHQPLNGPERYIVPPESINNKNIHVAPINAGINNFRNEYMENPIIRPVPRYPPVNPHPINRRYDGQPRRMASPVINSQPNSHVHFAHPPAVPVEAVLDEGESTRHVHKPVITKESNSYASLNTYSTNPIIQKDSNLSNTASNDEVIVKLTSNNKPTADDRQPNIFSSLAEENPNENVYDFKEGDDVKEFSPDPIQHNFVIIYANGTVEYAKNIDTDGDLDFTVVNKPFVTSPNVTSNFAPGSKQQISNNLLDSLPKNTSKYGTSVSASDNNYNSSSILDLQQSQDTTPSPSLETTVFNEKPHPGLVDNYNPVLTSLEHNHNRGLEPHENRHSLYNSNKDYGNGNPRLESKHLTHTSTMTTHTSTTTVSDDEMIQEFLDSLSINSENKQQLSDSNLQKKENIPNHDNNHPTAHTHTKMPPSQLHTVISPGIFKATTLDPDNLEIDKHDSSHALITATSSILSSGAYEGNLPDRTTLFPSSSDSDNNSKVTPEDQIITISPIELVTDNVRDDSLLIAENKESLEIEGVYTKEKVHNSDHDSKVYDSISSLPSNTDDLHDADAVDNVLTQVINKVEMEMNNTEAACDDSLANTSGPEIYDDNKAAQTNRNNVNTDKATEYNSLEIKPPKSGLEITLNIPNDSDGTLYIKVDAADATGNEETSNNDTLLVSITKQNDSEVDLITVKNDSDGHDYFNTAQTNSDETSTDENLKLDLSNALVIMNGTTDKDYLKELLSSDSKVNLFIFQMPCQDQAIVEKSKETTIYPNGTCIELLTETRWKNKDDPSPVIITMKKIYGGGECH